MGFREPTGSVIARLMASDESHPQRPVQKRQRVLSEKYLQRVASIGIRDNSRFREQLSFRKNKEARPKHKNVEVAGKASREKVLHNLWDQKAEANLGSIKPKTPDRGLKSGNSKFCLDECQGAPSHSQSRKISIPKSARTSRLMCRDSGKTIKQDKVPPISRYWLDSKYQAFLSRRRLLNGGLKVSNSLYSLGTGGWKDKYFGFSRFRPFSANFRTFEVQRRGSNNYFRQKNGTESRPLISSNKKSLSSRSLDAKINHISIGNHLVLRKMSEQDVHEDLQEESPMVYASLNQNLHRSSSEVKGRDILGQNNGVPEPSIRNFVSIHMLADTGKEGLNGASGDLMMQHFDKVASISVKDDNYLSHSLDDSIQQDSSIVYSEDGSGLSHCSDTDQDSFSSSERYQPSPDTVLENYFKDDRVRRAESLWGVGSKLHGLKMHLEDMKSEASEAFSEGSEVMVSSDEDNGELSVGFSEENRDLMRSFGVEESRDFSYLVDVLTEAGFLDRNLAFDNLYMPDIPVSPHIFGTLEKKYGEQMCWKRSERRLLFDRINLGLRESFLPCLGVPTWAKPVSKRLPELVEEVEDELWTLLVKQEKEACNDSSNKMLGESDKWLNLGDDIEFIGTEIEKVLFDELVAEIVSI